MPSTARQDKGRPIRTPTIIAGLFGLLLATGLVTYHGAGAVAEALLVAGWGLAAITAFHLIPILFSAMAWRAVLPRAGRPGLGALAVVRWVRESVNNLLPVAQVGGELVGARLLTFKGLPARTAGSSVVVDFTMGLVAQVLFTLMGLGLLAGTSSDPMVASVVAAALGGVGLLLAGLVGFVLAQHRGMFSVAAGLADRITRGWGWRSIGGGAARIDAAVRVLYRDRHAVLVCGAWRGATWIVGAGEIWITLYALGHPVSFAEALILESLGQAVRSAAFIVPGALGVQEGGFIVLGALLGLDAPTALAVSLAKRVRELALGVPGLLTWQAIEARRLVEGRNRAKAPAGPAGRSDGSGVSPGS